MFKRCLKSLILGIVISAVCSFAALAASPDGKDFPYRVELDVDECSRLCYAGHPGSTVVYKDGYAVMPDTTFRLVKNEESRAAVDPSELSITISLLYENENRSGSHREVIKQYNNGDLSLDNSFSVLSDNIAASLDDRGRLFSDSLNGLEMVLKTSGGDKEKMYLYVCDYDDYSDYLYGSSY